PKSDPAEVWYETWPSPGPHRLGTYSPDLSGLTLYGVADFDGGTHSAALADPLAGALALLDLLRQRGLAGHLERSRSGSGWHVWVFLACKAPAALVRRLLRGLLRLAPAESLRLAGKGGPAAPEVFPKRDTAPPDVGSQVWLPWHHAARDGRNHFHR